MKPEEFEVYVIPPNFMEGGTLFGGLLKTRNITALPAIRTAPLISSPRCFFPSCLSAWFAMRTNIVPAGRFRFLFMYLVKSCVPVE